MFQSALSTRGNLASYNQVHAGKLWKADGGERGVSAIFAVLIVSIVLQVSYFSVPDSSVWSRDGVGGGGRRSVGSVFCWHRPAGMAGAGANREGWGVLAASSSQVSFWCCSFLTVHKCQLCCSSSYAGGGLLVIWKP